MLRYLLAGLVAVSTALTTNAQCRGYSLDSPPLLSLDRPILAITDLNGDGRPDLVTDTAVHFDRQHEFPLPPGVQLVADFNRDGYPDLLGLHDGGRFFVLVNNRDETFTRKDILAITSASPFAYAIGDFNRDGMVDLVHGSIPMFAAGDGEAGFQPAVMIASGGINAMVSGDFDGDGILDFAAAYETRFGIPLTIFRGRGDGTFVEERTTTLSLHGPLVAADLDGDGRDEIIGSNYAAGSPIAIQWGDGRYTTLATSDVMETGFGNPIAAADLNGDGAPDVVVASSYRGNMFNDNLVFLNDGRGNLSIHWRSAGGDGLPSLLADVDGDGRPDLIARRAAFYSNGDGTFRDIGRLPAPTSDFAVAADLDGDGDDDVVLRKANPSDPTGPQIAIERRQGDGSFQQQILNDPRVTTLVGADDVNADGRSELLSTAGGYLNAVDVELDGSLQFIASLPLAEARLSSIAGWEGRVRGHFRGDGSTEIAQIAGSTVQIIDPIASAKRLQFSVDDGFASYRLAVADLNRDGRDDLIILADDIPQGCVDPPCGYVRGGFLSVYLSTGAGFAPEARIVDDIYRPLVGLALGDFNGDGIVDIATSEFVYVGSLVVLSGHGDGTFTTELPNGAEGTPVAADLNGDGIDDLILTQYNRLHLFLGSPSGLVDAGNYLAGSVTPIVSRPRPGGPATIVEGNLVFRPRCAGRTRAVRR
ncbi:MAG: FG-GAP repeat domain-containing protein [Thermoanaerobaculia bacterium]